jgi:hypothetical protein
MMIQAQSHIIIRSYAHGFRPGRGGGGVRCTAKEKKKGKYLWVCAGVREKKKYTPLSLRPGKAAAAAAAAGLYVVDARLPPSLLLLLGWGPGGAGGCSWFEIGSDHSGGFPFFIFFCLCFCFCFCWEENGENWFACVVQCALRMSVCVCVSVYTYIGVSLAGGRVMMGSDVWVQGRGVGS